MLIYLMRHADAEPKRPGGKDEERRLTEKGIEVTDRVSRGLKRMGVMPDLILSSPFVRAFETADIVRRTLGISRGVVKVHELVPDSDFDTLMKILSNLDVGSVMLVGHEPMLGEFTAWMICSARAVEYKKNSIACVEISNFSRCAGSLRWMIHAEQILNLIGK
jgi:phosphohistidine phosphatase